MQFKHGNSKGTQISLPTLIQYDFTNLRKKKNTADGGKVEIRLPSLIKHLLFFCHLARSPYRALPPHPLHPQSFGWQNSNLRSVRRAWKDSRATAHPTSPKRKGWGSARAPEPARAKMAGGAPRPRRPPTSSKLSFLFAFQRSLVQTLQTAVSHQEAKRITLVYRVRTDEIFTEHANRMCYQ